MIIFSHLLFIQAILKRNFHPKFSDDFLVIITKPKFLSTQFVRKMFWSPGYLYILAVSLEKVPVRHDLLYDTEILTYKIRFLIFISLYAVPALTVTKSPDDLQKSPQSAIISSLS